MAETGDWSQYRLTKAGRELRQHCIAEEIKMVFCRAAIGEGTPEEFGDINIMTGLVSYSRDVIIKKSYAVEENHLHIVRVDNSGYAQDVLMTEVGVYARTEQQADDDAILYGYAYHLDGYVKIPRQTSVTSRKVYEITLDTSLSATTEIQIIYDESSLWVSHADLDDLISSWSALERTPDTYLATVEHGLGILPGAVLYPSDFSYGVGGYGESPYGGGDFEPGIPVRLQPAGWNSVKVFSIAEYADYTQVSRLTDNLYALSAPNSITTLNLVLLR